MSDYYYLEDKGGSSDSWPILGDDYIEALFSIVKKNGVRITNEMIFEEINKKYPSNHSKRKSKNI